MLLVALASLGHNCIVFFRCTSQTAQELFQYQVNTITSAWNMQKCIPDLPSFQTLPGWGYCGVRSMITPR